MRTLSGSELVSVYGGGYSYCPPRPPVCSGGSKGKGSKGKKGSKGRGCGR